MHADLNDMTCYPSLNTIAKMASCSKKTAIKCIDRLEEAGYLKKESRKDKFKGNKSNMYYIVDMSYIQNVKDYSKQLSEGVVQAIEERLDHHPNS